MCTSSTKRCSTVVATLFFESAFVIFYDILTLSGVFRTEKSHSPIFEIRKNRYFEFLMKKRIVLNWCFILTIIRG